MSIVANYARISLHDLERCRTDQAFFRQVVGGDAPSVENIDLDQFWDAIAWLISESSRENAVSTYHLFLAADGELDDELPMPSAVQPDQMEQAIKGGSVKLHPQFDLGYGPASVLDSSHVRQVNNTLQRITHDQIRDRFDPPKMLGVHPDGWQHADSSAIDDMLIPCFDRYRAFIQRASENGDCVIVYFN